MKKLTLIIALLISVFASFAQSKWVSVSENTRGDKFLIKDDISSDGLSTIFVWVKTVYKKATTDKGKYSLQLYEFNTSTKEFRIRAVFFYSQYDRVIDSFQFNEYESEWNYVAPESIGETIMTTAFYLYKKTEVIQ